MLLRATGHCVFILCCPQPEARANSAIRSCLQTPLVGMLSIHYGMKIDLVLPPKQS